MDENYTALRRDVDELDEMLHGDSNFRPGIAARVRTLDTRDQKVRTMLKEWNDIKAQLSGAKAAIIGVGVLVSLLGGGMGVAIRTTLSRVAEALPQTLRAQSNFAITGPLASLARAGDLAPGQQRIRDDSVFDALQNHIRLNKWVDEPVTESP